MWLMKNILFLDIDGVLNINNSKLNKKFINNVNELCNIFKLDIVITSDWRLNGLETLRDEFKDEFPIFDITPIDDERRNRATEITCWLEEYKDVCIFLIIDDNFEQVFVESFNLNQFIITAMELNNKTIQTGFNNKKLKEAKQKLNKQKKEFLKTVKIIGSKKINNVLYHLVLFPDKRQTWLNI